VSKKDKKKKKEKEKKSHLNNIKIAKKCKTKCCEKYKKGEGRRCMRCPKFDLL